MRHLLWGLFVDILSVCRGEGKLNVYRTCLRLRYKPPVVKNYAAGLCGHQANEVNHILNLSPLFVYWRIGMIGLF